MARRLLVVDVGATDVKWAVATDGALGAVQRTPTRRGSIRQLIDQLSGLHSNAAASEPLPWALCTAGIVDTGRGRILWSGNLGLEDEPIVEQLAAAGSRPRFIVNDVDAAAVGEAAGERSRFSRLDPESPAGSSSTAQPYPAPTDTAAKSATSSTCPAGGRATVASPAVSRPMPG